MRRKLVNYEVFERIEKDSLSQAEYELMEAEDVLADILDSGPLSYRFFDNGKVVYNTDHGTYIHANYNITNESITFDDITELVVDTESQRKRLRECVQKMVEAIVDGNETEANAQFENYMKFFTTARKAGVTQMTESAEVVRFDKRQGGIVKQGHGGKMARNPKKSSKWLAARRKRELPSHKSKEMQTRRKNKLANVGKKIRLIKTGSSERKMFKEWNNLCENVNQYVDFVQHGHNVQNVEVKHNDVGEVSSVRIPTSKTRNEGKILTLQYKTLKTDVKILREAARLLHGDEHFVKTIAKIKRLNNMSHDEELEESIGDLVSKHPNVLYLTQDELANTIKLALENTNQVNFDDQTCQFMAEGILRVAHNAFEDRVARITQLAGAKVTTEGSADAYEQFQVIARGFYPKLDEALATEMQVYTDLYNAMVEVRRMALASNNETVREEATEFLGSLKAVLDGVSTPTLELAADAAEYLQTVVEANVDGSSEDWNISNSAYTTMVGEHPDMAKKAKQPGNPGSFTGDWGDPAPVSDGKSYKGGLADEMRNRGWGNKGGKEVWPSLDNPYVPKPFGDYTMKGEPGVDKNHDGGFAQMHGDTWPELQNPYVPKAISPWKAKTDNLIVDKGTGSMPSGPDIGSSTMQKYS